MNHIEIGRILTGIILVILLSEVLQLAAAIKYLIP